MPIRIALFLIILLNCLSGFAQINDSFDDGDFTTDPEWLGEADKFQISAGQLNNNGSGSDEVYIAASSSLQDYTLWEFYLQIDGSAPSGSNRARVYLTSNLANLEGSVDGYYIQIGQTGDDFVSLYRSDKGSGTLLATGSVAFDSQVSIQVIRDDSGIWTVSSDHDGNTEDGDSFTFFDNTYTSTSFFGWIVNHTSSRVDDFFLDDVLIDQISIENVEVTSNQSITVSFNQAPPISEVSSIANYTIAGLTLLAADQDIADARKVKLEIDPSTPLESQNYMLEVSATLTKNKGVTELFSYLTLALESIITPDEQTMTIGFNDFLDEGIVETLANFRVDNAIGQPTSSTMNASEKTVDLTFSTSFIEGVEYILTIDNIRNKSGNSRLTTTINFNYVVPLLLQDISVLSNRTVQLSFNKSLNLVSAHALANYVVNGGVGNPSAAEVLADASQVLLTFEDGFADQDYEIMVTSVADEDNNTIDVSANSLSFSYLNLGISSVTQQTVTSILVVFNQGLDRTSAENRDNYTITGIDQISNASRNLEDTKKVILTINGLRNSHYNLKVNNIRNDAENAIADKLSTDFNFNVSTNFREIVLNEVMADFTVPTGNQSTAYSGEYVEIYNPGSHAIRLEGFLLNNKELPAYTLESNEYVLIVDNSSEGSFSSSTNIIVINNFDALSTPRDSVILRDQFKSLVDSIYYDDDWFDDDFKADGGYSLEQINPELRCSEDNNWTATTNESGGTPGVLNSVFFLAADQSVPLLEELTVIGFDSVYVKFNEPMEESTISNLDFRIGNEHPKSVSYVSYTEVYLTLKDQLISEQFYTIQIENVADCSGNIIDPTRIDFYFDKKPPVLSIIRPIDFNVIALIFDEPIKESTAEREANFLVDNFIEPKSAIRQDSAHHRVHLTFESDFDLGDYSLQLINIEDTLGNEFSIAESFAIADQLDTILVIASRIIEVDFSEDVAVSSALNNNNYTLEGTQKPTEALFNQLDSSKVILAFSSDFKENDELTLYVENVNDRIGFSMITLAKTFIYDTRAPSIASVEAIDDTTLIVNFDEAIDTLVASSAINFVLNDAFFPTGISFPRKHQIQLEFDVKFNTEVPLKLSLKNVADLFGNVFTSTRNRTFVYDPLPPRVLEALPFSSNSMQISFNEKLNYSLASVLTNYSLDGTNPTKVVTQGPDSLNYILSFGILPQEEELNLEIDSLTDQVENIGTSYSIGVNTINPAVRMSTFLSDSSISLSFSQNMIGLDDLTSYAVGGFIIEAVSSPKPDSAILISETSFFNGDSIKIDLSLLKSVAGLDLQVVEVQAVFDSYVNQILFLDNKTLQLNTSTNFSSISKFSFAMDGETPSLATLGGEENEAIVLYFDKDIEENEALPFKTSSFQDLYGRLIPARTIPVINDTKPPAIALAEADFFNVITLGFSEKIDVVSALSLPSYSLLTVGKPVGVELVNDSTINMTFAFNLNEGSEYSIRVKNVADEAGNFLLDDTLTFNYNLPTLPERGDILISEIFADPSPSVGLPEVEYVELYNLSDKTFNLSVLQLSDPALTVRLPERQILPGEYVALVKAHSANQFSSGQVVGISQFPSLGNLGDSLRLKTITAITIDEVNYSSDWYADNLRDDGGYSLELINPEPTCPTFLNWSASTSPNGGTPGEQNSVYSLSPDTLAPKVIDFQLKVDTLEITFSEYMDSLSVVTTASEGFGISSISFNQEANEATFFFGQIMERNATYGLTLTGPKDCSGNEMEAFNIVLGDGYIPVFGEVIITEIMADPTPAIGLPEVEYLELYNATDKSFDLDVLFLSDPTKSVALPSREIEPGEYIALVPSSSIALFEGMNVIGVASLPNLGNTLDSLVLSNKYEETIEEINYSKEWYRNTDKDDGGYSLELINPMSPCPGQANWMASESELGGTPGGENSVFSLDIDAEAPVIIDQALLSDKTLRLLFSEALDTSSVERISFSGVSVDTFLITSQNATIVEVVLEEVLVIGVRYEILVSGIADCSGNIMEPATISFGKGRKPNFNEVLISEMMADPDPAIDLPSAEFFELQNMTADLISLDEVQLIVGDDSVFLSSIVLAPLEIVILCPTSAVASYSEFGTTYGLTGWISISNSADYVGLLNSDQLIFDMNYTADWYEKDSDGGISLEMKDTSNPCAEALNWSASVNTNGGTPGRSNSTSTSIPDNFGPELLQVDFSSPNSFEAVFNERLSSGSLDAVTVEITPSLNFRSILFTSLARNKIVAEFSDSFLPNQPYDVRFTNLEDCNGNLSKASSSFIYPVESVGTYIIINEILFNPKGDGVDYVEVYNISDDYVNLKDWQLGRIQDEEVSQVSMISESNLILGPKSYLVLTTDAAIVATQFPNSIQSNMHNLSSMPTYPNTDGTVALMDQRGTILDQFSYDEDDHSSLLEAVDGVSLERISFENPTNDRNNWTSASSLVDFGTPGYENSQILDGQGIVGRVSIVPKVFVPGLNGSAAMQSFTTINYTLAKSGMFANVNVYNQSGQLTKSLANGSSLSTAGFMLWNGTNESGDVVRMGYYIVVFELYDGSGNKEVMRETVVVGR